MAGLDNLCGIRLSTKSYMEMTLTDIPVMYTLSRNGPIGSSEAFRRVENALNWKLKGRKFYGVIDSNGEYKSCVAITSEDNPHELSLEIYTIPGGKYLREKIKDWEKHISQIKYEFDKLIKKAGKDLDKSRPYIEFYRSQSELFIYVPIK